MASARSSHTATLLSDGRVLVAGRGGDAEVYSPATDTWAPAASIASARRSLDQTATLLSDGRVLVVDGWAGFAEIYSPATNTWAPAASMADTRGKHTATLLSDGRVLVAGGLDGVAGAADPHVALSSAELYSPATNTWGAAASMADPRGGHTATLLSDGRVLVAGGVDLDGYGVATGVVYSAEVYSPTTNTWAAAGSMTDDGSGWAAHTATTLLSDGRVLVADRGRKQLYNPVANAWAPAAWGYDGPIDTATLLRDGRVFLNGWTPLVYSPATDTEAFAASMITQRYGSSATLLSDGRVLVAGGAYDMAVFSSVEIYTPSTTTGGGAGGGPGGGGTGDGAGEDGGCGCGAGASGDAAGLLVLGLALGAVASRRRRRA